MPSPGRFAFPVAFAVLAAASLLPLTKTVYMPMVDYPQHAYQAALWYETAHDPGIAASYDIAPLHAYSAVHFAWRWLMELGLSVHGAGKAVIAFGLIGLPLAFWLLLRARGRPEWPALFAFPVVYHHALAFGFMPFFFATTLAFFGLAAFASWLLRPTPARALLVCVLGMPLPWCHVLATGFFGLACGIMALTQPGSSWRRCAVALTPLLPIGAATIWWTATQPWLDVRGSFRYDATFWQRVGLFPHYLCGGFTPEAQRAATPILALALCAAVLGALAAARAAYGVRSSPRGIAFRRMAAAVARAHDRALFLGGLSALLLYFAVPFDMGNTSWLNGRFAPFAFLLLVGATAEVPWKWLRAILAACAIVVALRSSAALTRAFTAFAGELGDAPHSFAALPRGASVSQPDDGMMSVRVPGFYWPIFVHLALNPALETLGPTYSWTSATLLPVHRSQDQETRVARFDLAVTNDNHLVIRPKTEALADFIVIHTPRPLPDNLAVAGRSSVYRVAARPGHLTLYARGTARPGILAEP